MDTPPPSLSLKNLPDEEPALTDLVELNEPALAPDLLPTHEDVTSAHAREHARLLSLARPHIEELATLYALVEVSELRALMQQQRAVPKVPAWALVAMTRRMMRATESEQCLLLHAMAQTDHARATCAIARQCFPQANLRLKLVCCAVFAQLGDRQDHHFLHILNDPSHEQELCVAIKRALATIEGRHPVHTLAASHGSLSLSSLATHGSLTEHDALDTHHALDITPSINALFKSERLQTLEVARHAPEKSSALATLKHFFSTWNNKKTFALCVLITLCPILASISQETYLWIFARLFF